MSLYVKFKNYFVFYVNIHFILMLQTLKVKNYDRNEHNKDVWIKVSNF